MEMQNIEFVFSQKHFIAEDSRPSHTLFPVAPNTVSR